MLARPVSIVLCLTSSALAASAPARAQSIEYHVDAIHGSDAAGSGSAGAPWKTITKALATIPDSIYPSTLHVSPGLYDAALGEEFPLVLDDGQPHIRGAGIGATIVDGGGVEAAIVLSPDTTSFAPAGSPLIERMTIRDAEIGLLWYVGSSVHHNMTLRDLAIEDTRSTGFHYQVADPGASLYVYLERCRFASFGTGIEVLADMERATVRLLDCSLENGRTACRVAGSHLGYEEIGEISLAGSTIRSCKTGIELDGTTYLAKCSLGSSLIVGCDTAVAAFGWGARMQLGYSTVTANRVGLFRDSRAPRRRPFTLMGAIVWGNQVLDVDPFAVESASYSNTTPLLPGQGNTSVDPVFAFPGSGDYHLALGSPLIDAGDPPVFLSYGFGTDADLDPRELDGDGDGVARLDVGYDELDPVHLAASGTPALGASIGLVTTAPPAASFCAAVSPDLDPLGLPIGSWGSLLIDPDQAVVLGCGTTPGTVVLSIPLDPALSGFELHAQSLAWVQIPFPGWFSNRVDLAIP